MAGRLTSVGESAQQLGNVAKLISEAQTLDANGDELVRWTIVVLVFDDG